MAGPANWFVPRVPLVRIDQPPAAQASWPARIALAAGPARQIAPVVLSAEARTMAPSVPTQDRALAAPGHAQPSAWVSAWAWSFPQRPPSWRRHHRRYRPPPPAQAAVDNP